ncbi:hypothetical protein BZA70DRAFT_19958 [Myxozyma melibiosi]|uniref:Uncharacterized protein n=1 Tax=Myxozyma melibiosi TaxID=54550 RepID=A0ABR1FCM2_9ASCO
MRSARCLYDSETNQDRHGGDFCAFLVFLSFFLSFLISCTFVSSSSSPPFFPHMYLICCHLHCSFLFPFLLLLFVSPPYPFYLLCRPPPYPFVSRVFFYCFY